MYLEERNLIVPNYTSVKRLTGYCWFSLTHKRGIVLWQQFLLDSVIYRRILAASKENETGYLYIQIISKTAYWNKENFFNILKNFQFRSLDVTSSLKSEHQKMNNYLGQNWSFVWGRPLLIWKFHYFTQKVSMILVKIFCAFVAANNCTLKWMAISHNLTVYLWNNVARKLAFF